MVARSVDVERVLVIAESIYLGDPRVRRTTRTLTEAGYAVDVICQAERQHSWLERAETDGAHLYYLPVQKQRGGRHRYLLEYASFGIMALLLAARLHARYRYSIIYVHTMPDVLVFAAIIPKLLGARVILDVHDPFPEMIGERFGCSPQHRIVRAALLAERLSHRFADQVITVHTAMARLLARSTPRSEIAIVMNVAPVERFLQMRPSPPTNRFVITYAGTVTKHYGLDLAFDAMHTVREVVPSALLRIIGDGPHLGRLKERVLSEHLQHCVEFVGTVPPERIPEELGASHCGICPVTGQLWDSLSFSNKIYEYVASGLPAVIPRTQLLSAYYPDGAVVFYRPDDAGDFASKLIDVYQGGQELRAQLLQERDAVLRSLSWTEQQQVLLNCVDQLLTTLPVRRMHRHILTKLRTALADRQQNRINGTMRCGSCSNSRLEKAHEYTE